MKSTFVETSNAREFAAALTKFNARGAEEACLVVVDGDPGLGKTHTMSRWVAQTGSIYLRAQKGWDYSWFIEDLLMELSIKDAPRGRRAKFRHVIEALTDRAASAMVEGRTFGLVIDECDLVSSRAEIMEAIRGISDVFHLPTILVGMGKLRDHLRRFPQIESRGPRKVKFKPADLGDVQALIAGRCEVPVAPNLVQYVHRLSRGYNREIMEAIANIERFGLRMDVGPEGVTIDDMAGQVIMSDRTSGADIIVRRVM